MASLIDDADSVLVVVDVQPGFLGKLEEAEARQVEDRVRWVARLASHLDVPIVVTEEAPDRNGVTSEVVTSSLPDGLPRHTKEAFGLASCPDIMSDLERHGRRTAVVCGLETDVCVAQSALGLREAGWRVVVIRDAVASPGSAHELGLSRMRDAGIELIGTKGLAYEWLRTVERASLMDVWFGGDEPMGITL